MSRQVYKTAIVFRSGFTQRAGNLGNGVEQAFDDCYRRRAGADCLVLNFPWYIGSKSIADRLARIAEECLHTSGHNLRIMLVGYSFGGRAAVDDAIALQAYGLTVHQMVLCDPVNRRGRFGLGLLKAMSPWGSIEVPPNVEQLRIVFQANPRWQLKAPFFWPAGHTVVVHPEYTRLRHSKDVTDKHTHTSIDNGSMFHSLSFHAENEVIKQTPGNEEVPF